MPHPSIRPSDPNAPRPSSSRVSTPVAPPFRPIPETRSALVNAPPIPPRSAFRRSTSSLSLPRDIFAVPPPRPSTSAGTSRTAPPAYEWIEERNIVEDASLDDGPVEGEKLAALRRAGGYKPPPRGGWWRLGVIAAVALLVIIGLAVGLGVGLTVGRKGGGSSDGSSSGGPATSNSTMPESHPQPFPLGQYSLPTVLQSVTTDCTSNPDTWTCYPLAPGSVVVLNWALSNTSADYATIDTPATSDEGIPSNLTISSTNSILGFPFTDKPLTYISSAANSSSARYTFSFDMAKAVVPTASITSDNVLAECFFNQTTFTGTLYLTAAGSFSDNIAAQDNSTIPYTRWPYAVEVTQVSNGGQNTPACYEYINGAVGNQITTGLTPQAADTQCLCDYRNF